MSEQSKEQGLRKLPPSTEPWVDTTTIAKHLGVLPKTIRDWCLKTDFPHVRLGKGREIRTKVSWVDEWLVTKDNPHDRTGIQRLRRQESLRKRTL
jgi:hypothetical protein